jgi:hypothetical protein
LNRGAGGLLSYPPRCRRQADTADRQRTSSSSAARWPPRNGEISLKRAARGVYQTAAGGKRDLEAVHRGPPGGERSERAKRGRPFIEARRRDCADTRRQIEPVEAGDCLSDPANQLVTRSQTAVTFSSQVSGGGP